MFADSAKVSSDLRGRQNEIHAAGGDGRLRHPAICSRVRVLRERDAAGRLDGFNAQCAVGARTREDDADRSAPLYLREGPKERVNWPRRPVAFASLDSEMTVHQRHGGPWRDDVCPIALDAVPIARLHDRD